MMIKLSSLQRFYLLLATLYYVGAIRFIGRLSSQGGDKFSANASGSMLNQLVGLGLLGLGVCLIMRMDKQVLSASLKKSAWCWLLLGYFALSLFWSYDPGVTLRRVIALTTLMVAAFYLVDRFELSSLLLYLAQAIALVAAVGLLYAVIFPGSGFVSGELRGGAFVGMLGDKNAGARYYVYATIILIGLGRFRSKPDVAILGLLLLCILLAKSASAIVMLFAGVGLTLLLGYLRSNKVTVNFRRLLGTALLLVVTCLLIYYLYEFLLALLGRDPGLTNRALIWELMDQQLAREPLFGFGFGAFWSGTAAAEFVERWGYIGNAHSGYYEALLQGGQIGLAVLLIAIFFSFKNMLGGYMRQANGHLFAILIALMSVQLVANYVAYIVLNYNSFDMFLFALITFAAGHGSAIALAKYRQANLGQGQWRYKV